MSSDNIPPTQAIIETGAHRIIAVQALLSSVIGWFFYIYQDQLAGQSALYGGCMAIFNVWITQRRVRIAAEVASVSPGKETTVLYIAAVQRFSFTLAFFMVGMGWLELPPIPMLIAFSIAQVGYFFSGRPNTAK
jgi:ATP synthase protein I